MRIEVNCNGTVSILNMMPVDIFDIGVAALYVSSLCKGIQDSEVDFIKATYDEIIFQDPEVMSKQMISLYGENSLPIAMIRVRKGNMATSHIAQITIKIIERKMEACILYVDETRKKLTKFSPNFVRIISQSFPVN